MSKPFFSLPLFSKDSERNKIKEGSLEALRDLFRGLLVSIGAKWKG